MGDIVELGVAHPAEAATDVPPSRPIGHHRQHITIDRGIGVIGLVVGRRGGIGLDGDAATGRRPHIGEVPAEIKGGAVRGRGEVTPDEERPARQGHGNDRVVHAPIPGQGIVAVHIRVERRQTAAGLTANGGERAPHVEGVPAQQEAVYRAVGIGVPGRGAILVDGAGIDGGKAVARLSADEGEVSPEIEFAIPGGKSQGAHGGVGARVPGPVHGAARRADGGEAAAGLPAHRKKIATDIEHRAVPGEGHVKHVPIGRRIPGGDNAAAAGIQGRQAAALGAAHGRETAAGIEPRPVGGQHQHAHAVVRAGIPGAVHGARGAVQPGHAITVHPRHEGKIPPHIEGLAIARQGQGAHLAVGARIPVHVHALVSIDAGDVVARRPAHLGEGAADKPAAAAVGYHRVDPAIHVRIGGIQQHRIRVEDNASPYWPAIIVTHGRHGMHRTVGHPQVAAQARRPGRLRQNQYYCAQPYQNGGTTCYNPLHDKSTGNAREQEGFVRHQWNPWPACPANLGNAPPL